VVAPRVLVFQPLVKRNEDAFSFDKKLNNTEKIRMRVSNFEKVKDRKLTIN